jgi:multidrug efflux pump subunit AcrA (membrane-fusion protein)
MKTLACAATVAATVLLSGCNRSAAESTPSVAASVPAEPAAAYNAARGLKITPFAGEFIQLATDDFTGTKVPATAVLRTVQGTFVYVENGGWFLRTPVKLGAPSPDGTWLTLAEGLYEGDRIVTQGVRSLWLAELHFLRAGQACAHEG